MSSAPAGWYVDPTNPTQYRYWTGQAWSSAVSPASAVAVAPGGSPVTHATAPPPPPPYPDQRDGFLRLDGLTTALTTLFIAVAVVAASSIGALANQRRVIDRIRAGQGRAPERGR